MTPTVTNSQRRRAALSNGPLRCVSRWVTVPLSVLAGRGVLFIVLLSLVSVLAARARRAPAALSPQQRQPGAPEARSDPPPAVASHQMLPMSSVHHIYGGRSGGQ